MTLRSVLVRGSALAALALATSYCNRGDRGTSQAAQQPADPNARPVPALAPAAGEARPSDRTPDVVYVPTPQPVVDRMLEVANVTKDDILYDLGCGDGRIVVTAALRFGTRAYGFDIDPVRVAEARENVKKNDVERLVTIEQRDIFELDLSPATVVTLYLLPSLNVKLIPQLEKLRPGARVVSHDFDMAGVKPDKELSVRPPGVDREHDIYLWLAPIQRDAERARSRWQAEPWR
jgi:SAM-dependent methyltransferase